MIKKQLYALADISGVMCKKDIFPKESYTALVAILEYYMDQYKQCYGII